jgi:membrane protein
MSSLLSQIKAYLSVGIWRVRVKDLPAAKAVPIRLLRTLLMAVKGFVKDQCYLRAAALSLYTLLSIVPVVAMAFGIAKGFGLEKRLEEEIMREFAGQTEVLQRVIDFADKLLTNTRGGIIAGVGLIVLLWTVIKVLGHIEHSFNDIWGVEKPRSWGRKVADYITFMLICPLLWITASSVTVYITTQVTRITNEVELLSRFDHLIAAGLKLGPYALIWVLFSVTYILMPNTKVTLKSGIVAGIVAGTVFQLVQWLYIHFQIGVAKYNAIYGSFAALPLFLIWVQISWYVVLFGAEIAHADQTGDEFELEPDYRNLSPYQHKVVALQVLQLISRRFAQEKAPLPADALAQELNLPLGLVRDTTETLMASGLINQTQSDDGGAPPYQPAVDIHRLTLKKVLEAMEHRQGEPLDLEPRPETAALAESLKHFGDAMEQSPANRLLKDIE